MEAPAVKTGMLIRRPADEVYQAFTEPGVTSWFWFTHADRRLAPGAHHIEEVLTLDDVLAGCTSVLRRVEPNPM